MIAASVVFKENVSSSGRCGVGPVIRVVDDNCSGPGMQECTYVINAAVDDKRGGGASGNCDIEGRILGCVQTVIEIQMIDRIRHRNADHTASGDVSPGWCIDCRRCRA